MKIKERIYITIAVSLFLTLIVVTLLHKQPPFWDEAYYLDNVDLLKSLGWSREFLVNYKGPAGPTFAIVHYILSPITALSAPAVRMVNIGFLIITMFLTYLSLKKIDKSASSYNTLSILAIPTVYTIAGMALTEMIAVFFLSLSIYLIISAFRDNKINYIKAVMAGLSMSAAILGRQPLLLVVLALPILIVRVNGKKVGLNFSKQNFLKFLSVAIVSSLLLPMWIFSVWGNIQPVSQALTGIGLAPNHLLIALGYACLHLFLVNPAYFNFKRDFSNKKELGTVFFLSLVSNIFLFKVRFPPFENIINKVLPQHLLPVYALFCGTILAVLGISFAYFFLKKQMSERDSMSIFFSVSFLLVVISSIKVTHQFSARYVAQAFPLLILCVSANKKEISVWSMITLLVGGVLGLISLEAHFD